MDYYDLKSKIQDLAALPFNFREISVSIYRVKATDLLRKAQIYYSQIHLLSDCEKEEELNDLLNTTLIKRFRKLAPQFDDELLNKMLCFMHRGFIKYPMDILVIDNAVFIKEAEFDDWSNLYDYEIIMYRNDDYFLAFDQIDFTMPNDIDMKVERVPYEILVKLFDFISDSINKALYESFGCNAVMPLYRLNKNGSFYGYEGLVKSDETFETFELCFNKKSFEIVDDIVNQKQCDTKMILQNGDNISLYIIHQTIENDKPVWNIEKSNEQVWVLSENVGGIIGV